MAKIKTKQIVLAEDYGKLTIGNGDATVTAWAKDYRAEVAVSVNALGNVGKKTVVLPEHLAERADALFAEINAYYEKESE